MDPAGLESLCDRWPHHQQKHIKAAGPETLIRQVNTPREFQYKRAPQGKKASVTAVPTINKKDQGRRAGRPEAGDSHTTTKHSKWDPNIRAPQGKKARVTLRMAS